MTDDTLEAIHRDFLHHIAGAIDAYNRLVNLYAPHRTTLVPVAMQVRAEVVPDAPPGQGDHG